jgi:hypothetical protein
MDIGTVILDQRLKVCPSQNSAVARILIGMADSVPVEAWVQ